MKVLHPVVAAVLALLVAAVGAGGVWAEVPIEVPGRVETLATPTPHWAVVSDLLMQRAALVDLDSGAFLGMISTGYMSTTALAPREVGTLYVPETFYSRGSRGERTDVVTIYDVASLEPVGEVAIPPKRAINVLATANATLTDDGRFLLVFNLNPSTSVSVVDTRTKSFVAEVPLPGCGLVFAAGDRRFFSVCGDGGLLVVTLDDTGKPGSVDRTEPFFDPEADPVTEKAVRAGDRWIFVSFEGMAHPVDVSGDAIRFEESWSLLRDEDREQSWRVGGSQHLAVHEGTGRLFSLVHQGGPHSHKDPGDQVWVYDLASRERVQRIELAHPGFEILSESFAFGSDWIWPFDGLYELLLSSLAPEISHILVTRDDAPLLLTASQLGGSLGVYDADSGELLRRVGSGNLSVQRIDAPFDGGGSR